jgi:hypothetical protein
VKTLSLLKKYSDQVDPVILSKYKQPDRFLWVNTGDKDLTPIRIDLPKAPEYHLIDGFGKPAKDQMWAPPKLPRRLKEIAKKGKYETIDEIWDELQKNQDIYEDEIKFIKKQWYYRLNGYWFFNNGKPTYIDGWHYFYIAWWKIDVGLPKYRDRDRKFFLFARHIYLERKTFTHIDEKGNAIRNEETGYFDLIDTGGRVFYGFNYPKHRREGATYKAECINYEIISRTIGAWGGIQSMNEVQGRKCFIKHLIGPWKKLPFFFKPNYEGSTSPKTEISFSPPARRLSSKGSIASSEIGLESMINFGPADPGSYDGDKLYCHHDDEVGKLKKGLSCWDRHLVVKECLSMGSDIIGFTIKTSTVGEMERGGGKAFKHQCSMSDYFVRTPNGQTRSGLATLFISAEEGLQGFIDQYGQSVIETPTKEQAAFIGRKIGAREYLQNRRKGYIDAGDYEGLSEEIRLYPMNFTECFRTAAKGSGFNMQKLETYIDELRFKPGSEMPVDGDFRRVGNNMNGRVEFIQRKGGKFRVSHQLNDDESNRKYWNDELETWTPGNTSFGVAGGDPFKFNKTEGNRKSKGGGAVVRKGKIKDGDFSMKRKFVCTYNNRTYDKYEYAEDMLMMCEYYGVKMFPEINVDLLWDYFEQRGYSGFLLYRVDPKTFQQNKTPGANTTDKIKQDIFTEYMNFIEFEAEEENHVELLEECRDIAGPEEMTDFDLFTAGGYALLGTAGIYDEIEELEEQEVDLGNFHRKKTYRK